MQYSNISFVISVVSIIFIAILVFMTGKHVEVMYVKADLALPTFTMLCWKSITGFTYSLFCVLTSVLVIFLRLSKVFANDVFAAFNSAVLGVHLVVLAILFWGLMLPFATN